MIRAAAKNYKNVTVVVDPVDYPSLITAIRGNEISLDQRLALAKKAFARTAAYDGAISNYLFGLGDSFPTTYTVQFSHGRTLRYGENPHRSLQCMVSWVLPEQSPSRESRCPITIIWM